MRSGSQSSFACYKIPHGKDHHRKTRNERTTGCRNSWFISIRHKQVHLKRQRKHHNNRKRTRGASPHRPDDKLAHVQLTSKERNSETLLQNMPSNPRKRIDVPALPSENRQHRFRNMRFLPSKPSLKKLENYLKQNPKCFSRQKKCRRPTRKTF